MRIERPKNTKERGVVEFLTYKEGDAYIGVCLTFDIVEEGTSPIELMRSITEAAELHLETVVKNNLSEDLLNRYAPEEYWEKYFQATGEIKAKGQLEQVTSFPVVSPYSSSVMAQLALSR